MATAMQRSIDNRIQHSCALASILINQGSQALIIDNILHPTHLRVDTASFVLFWIIIFISCQ